MMALNKARGILTDDAERLKYDSALDRLKSNDGENPGLVEIDGDNAGIAEIQSSLPMGVAPEQIVEATTAEQIATTAEQIVTIGCAYKKDNFEFSPKDFDELEAFIKEDSNLQPKSYEITYTKNGKQFKISN